jgi:hypothetical protein
LARLRLPDWNGLGSNVRVGAEFRVVGKAGAVPAGEVNLHLANTRGLTQAARREQDAAVA